MATNNVLGIIFSNAYDEVLPELTALRTMGSVPFAGRYRLIDFPLSNMVDAGHHQGRRHHQEQLPLADGSSRARASRGISPARGRA